MSREYNPYSVKKYINLKKKFEGHFIDEIYKNSNSPKKEKLYLWKIVVILYYAIGIYLFYSILLIKCQQKRLQFDDSIIQLKVKGSGNMNILSNYYSSLPNKIFINEEEKQVQTKYYFENSENNIHNVTLKWNDGVNPQLANMFKGCSNIIEINFVNFDTSHISDMSYIFEGCSSLIHLNLSIFNTSSAGLYNNMFSGCTSLTSLDLSSFDSSKVTQFGEIFAYCRSLKYLDISNFNTSSASFGNYIFSDCYYLEFLNLKSAVINSFILTQISILSFPNLTICSKNDTLKTSFPTNKEIICKNNSLLDDTTKDDSLKCYTKHNSNKLSSYYSCEICGKNYYQLYNEQNNLNMICYKFPLGFY